MLADQAAREGLTSATGSHMTARTSGTPRSAGAARSVVLTTVLAVVSALLLLPAGPAAAAETWTAAGPGTVTTDSDGSASAARMSYSSVGGGFADQTWTFTRAYQPGGEGEGEGGFVSMPWTWEGYHAYFDVDARLEMIVDGEVVPNRAGGPFPGEGVPDIPREEWPLVDAHADQCCEAPSGGFSYGGDAIFFVHPGQTFGFRITGRNFDSDNTVRGSLTLSSQPFVEPGIGAEDDNRQWPGAQTMDGASLDGKLLEPGETRWFKFPVVPNQNVRVDLSELPADYDLALYGDIQQAFDELSDDADPLAKLSSTVNGTVGAQDQVPSYPTSVQDVPTEKPQTDPGPTFAPRIYAPRIYAPRIYAPRIYAPRIYAPRIYAPRIYAPGSFDPYLESTPGFQQAFSAAQNQTLLAVSADTGRASETVSARTGNTSGFFYVRVQGHNDRVFSTDEAFRVSRRSSGGDGCGELSSASGLGWKAGVTPPVNSGSAEAVIVTDSSKLSLDEEEVAPYLAKLQQLADATFGVVLDVSQSDRVAALREQAEGSVRCPYAVNLVADAIADLVEEYRNDQTRYVVVAGGDEVVPFFRYPDVSGLGQESQFEPPMRSDSASGVSLATDQVLSQDAYGSRTHVTIAGVSMPVPDLAVGRLVKTPDDIAATVDHFLGLEDQTLPAPDSSLVTGYDFLEDAATRVDEEFTRALGDDATDTLITPSGTPYDESWTAADLRAELLGDTEHDLLFLAGHFSANDTLAADFTTTLAAEELRPVDEDTGDPTANAGKLTDALVMSAGCHSGYTIVDGEAVTTDRYDWTQAMAQQQAVLLGGTGYQYGDTEFLEYSERIYLNVARQLRRGSGPAAIGEALTAAKRDYLASLVQVSGIDQKSVLQATMYGLPMTRIDLPGREAAAQRLAEDTITPEPVSSGPGSRLNLMTADRRFATPTTPGSRPVTLGAGLPDALTWLNGEDGVSVLPGAPVLPKQVENVTGTSPWGGSTTLRGVGFRGGSYRDVEGLLPLTGAPGIEGSTAHTTFSSDAFWPQRLMTPNYFENLGTRGSSGRTSLILTPAQYRTDDATRLAEYPTNTRRAFSNLDARLFYGSDSSDFSGNRPYTAAAPAITAVEGTVTGRTVTFAATVTGDPSAGVQQVWATWTSGPDDSGDGSWDSVDLEQSPTDSTRWTGTLQLPDGAEDSDVRFLLQAVNGAGSVALDTADGDGHPVVPATTDTAEISLGLSGAITQQAPGIVATVTGSGGRRVPDRTVRFTVAQGSRKVVSLAPTDATGRAVFAVPLGDDGTPVRLPTGPVTVTADLLPVLGSGTDEVTDSDSRTATVQAVYTLTVTPPFSFTRAGTSYPWVLRPVATVREGDARAPGVPVTFTLPTSGPRATFPGGATSWVGTTDAEGRVQVPAITAGTTVGLFDLRVEVDGAEPRTVPMTAQYAMTAFRPPVKSSGVTRTTASATVPLRTTALLANGAKLSDADAAALVSAGRVQVAWHSMSTSDSGSRNDLAGYDARADRFVAKVRPSLLGWRTGQTYLVAVRILPATSAPALLDLGARLALIQVR